MPEEIAIIFTLLILSFFALTMTSMILRHRRKQKESGSAGPSLTTGDLEQLMRRAVEDATAPLATKIEDLELEIARMGQGGRQLVAHDPGTLLDLDVDAEEEVLDVQPVRAGRARS